MTSLEGTTATLKLELEQMRAAIDERDAKVQALEKVRVGVLCMHACMRVSMHVEKGNKTFFV